jgi:hypothetical protein
MSVNLEIRELLPQDSIVLDDSSFDNSIIGTTQEGNVVYDFNKMIEEFSIDNDCDSDEAIEWIEYNTMRAIPYFPNPRPIIIYPLEVT